MGMAEDVPRAADAERGPLVVRKYSLVVELHELPRKPWWRTEFYATQAEVAMLDKMLKSFFMSSWGLIWTIGYEDAVEGERNLKVVNDQRQYRGESVTGKLKKLSDDT